jgi:hypothetical protein
MSTETETKKITRKVYKNKGCVHVCWKGMCYEPPAGSAAVRGMTVEIAAEKGSPRADVYLPTDEGDERTCERWGAVDTHWRAPETKPDEAPEPTIESDIEAITESVGDLCTATEVDEEDDTEEVDEEEVA